MTLQVSHDNLRELGWHRIQTALADRAATEPGRDALMQLGFLPDADTIASVLATVDELTQLLAKGGDLPLSGTRDLGLALMRARRGAVLQKDELLDIARTATACHGVRRHLLFHQVHHPRLGAKGLQLPELGTLARELSETFDAAGEIRDDASPELAAARARLIGLHRNVKERLETFLLRPELEGVLQDSFYTQREDRYVVPVISSFQREVPGIIHGTSNSGETVFVEPGELIEANNAIKVADATVRMEVERVLRIRSEWVRAEADALAQAMTGLIELDALQARARLAADLDAVVPLLADPATPGPRSSPTDEPRARSGLAAGTIQLRQARNPHLLLKGSRVVANDIALGPNQAFLVVTGPNTGGKTVTLSTVGTMLMMVSAGCPIPVSEGSVITPFSSLWALIGDAQDLERDLSTFSGHLKAIHTILDAAEPGALVLLDEIIVGTEPQQGAALAIAVLESLADRGARGFVTTHYERLKTLAYEDPRFANASVGVDPETQAPNFQLAIGRPGSSNPFDVALRLGFPSHLVQRARDVAGGHSGLGEALARLEAAERRADDAAREAGKARDLAAQERERLNSERLRLKREAKLEVEALAREAKERIKELLAEIREARERVVESAHRFQDPRTGKSQAEDEKRSAQRLGDRLDEARALLPDEHPEGGAAKPAASSGPKDGGDLAPADARPGLAVWVRALDKLGEIVELRGERATVAVGIMKTQVHLSDLGRVRGLDPTPARAQGEAKRQAEPSRGGKPARMVELPEDDARIPPPRTDGITADLRGARRDEVHERVEPLLDRAYRDGIDAIWVIHGHGTGALRDEVRELLSRSPQVAGYRRGRRHEGGDGVTIAFLARD